MRNYARAYNYAMYARCTRCTGDVRSRDVFHDVTIDVTRVFGSLPRLSSTAIVCPPIKTRKNTAGGMAVIAYP
jgi:hypothetical protein